ncbi:MAG: hypothetical protein AAF195_03855 [Pseudomonadota bacterium]
MLLNVIKDFKIYFTPKLLIILMLGFSSGLPLLLTGSTLTLWLADVGINITTIGLLAAVGTPYSLKFLWSQFIDHIPLPILNKFLGQRRSWMLVTQLLLMYSIYKLGTSDPLNNILMVTIWALAVAIASASQDIAVDAYRIELLEEKLQGYGAASYVFGYRMAMLVAGAGIIYLSTFLHMNIDPNVTNLASDTQNNERAAILANEIKMEQWSTGYFYMALLMLVGVIATLLGPKITNADGETSDPATDINNENTASKKFSVKIILCSLFAILSLLAYYLWTDSDNLQLILNDINITNSYKIDLYRPLMLLFTSIYVITLLLLLVIYSTSKSIKYILIEPFKDFTKRPSWILIILFVILFKFGDAFAGSLISKFLIDIEFDKITIANIVKSFGMIATIIGAALGGVMIKYIGIYKSLWVSGILQMLSNLMFAVQAYFGNITEILALTITVENLSGGMGTSAFVAYLSMLCNRQFTATQYALVSSLSATARTILVSMIFVVDLSYFGEISFVERLGWINFFVLTTLTAIPGLFILHRLTKSLEKGSVQQPVS